MIRQLVLIALVVGSGPLSTEIANSRQPTRASSPKQPPATKPPTTKPATTSLTAAEKTAELNRRVPLDFAVTGGRRRWTYAAGIEGEPLEARIVAIIDGVVTLRDADDVDHDVAVAELATLERLAVERVAGLTTKHNRPDERALLGSWFTEQVADHIHYLGGDPPKSEKLIIGGVQMRERFGSPPLLWTIDPTATPKRIDFGTGYPNDVERGIYELDGDRLRICLDRSGRHEHPKAFVDGPDSRLWTYRRLPNVMSLPPLKADELDPQLAATLHEYEAMFSAETIDESAAKFIRPDEAAKLTPSERTKRIALWNKNRRENLELTRAMLRVAPIWNANRTSAYFDFARVHIDRQSEAGGYDCRMTKIGDRWYPGGPEIPRRTDSIPSPR